jgi:hypothetical protein
MTVVAFASSADPLMESFTLTQVPIGLINVNIRIQEVPHLHENH